MDRTLDYFFVNPFFFFAPLFPPSPVFTNRAIAKKMLLAYFILLRVRQAWA
jgi:hypothetical protein